MPHGSDLSKPDVMYVAQMFAKLIFPIEGDFPAITSFNLTVEFRFESWAMVLRLIMTIKVIRTAATG